jgi:predicted ATP-dependent endonuclease of OLD family
MKIQSVRIKNFRALKDVTIPFDSVTTFIGPNGAGKSTVLHALDWFFNGKPGSLTEKDCSFGELMKTSRCKSRSQISPKRIGRRLVSTLQRRCHIHGMEAPFV